MMRRQARGEIAMAETAAPPRPADQLERGPAYDEDFFLWTQRQAALIRAGQFELMDLEHVAEEIESLGISDRRQLRNRLEVLMMHLLKWQFQPMHRSRSWRSTIRTQRGRIEQVLQESPSLRREVAELSRKGYGTAREAGSAETGFATGTFPKSLPYTPEQILDDDFYPGPIDER
jgi:Domain of unknown function DUF29